MRAFFLGSERSFDSPEMQIGVDDATASSQEHRLQISILYPFDRIENQLFVLRDNVLFKVKKLAGSMTPASFLVIHFIRYS
jgi:hypothetical protein